MSGVATKTIWMTQLNGKIQKQRDYRLRDFYSISPDRRDFSEKLQFLPDRGECRRTGLNERKEQYILGNFGLQGNTNRKKNSHRYLDVNIRNSFSVLWRQFQMAARSRLILQFSSPWVHETHQNNFPNFTSHPWASANSKSENLSPRCGLFTATERHNKACPSYE